MVVWDVSWISKKAGPLLMWEIRSSSDLDEGRAAVRQASQNECARSLSPGVLLKCKFWFSMFWVGFETLHFWLPPQVKLLVQGPPFGGTRIIGPDSKSLRYYIFKINSSYALIIFVLYTLKKIIRISTFLCTSASNRILPQNPPLYFLLNVLSFKMAETRWP